MKVQELSVKPVPGRRQFFQANRGVPRECCLLMGVGETVIYLQQTYTGGGGVRVLHSAPAQASHRICSRFCDARGSPEYRH